MILYKYLSEERLSILDDGLVRFTQPQAFNDPFELKPYLKSLASESVITDELNEQFESIFKEEYSKLPPATKNNISYSKFLEFSYTKKEEVVSNVLNMSKQIIPALNNEMHKAFDNRVGILSLTENDHNLLMWAHYANCHQGYVIGFDSTHEFFNQRKSENDEIRALKKVCYSSSRPNLELISIESFEPFIIKSLEWEYEKEWRMLHSLKDSDNKLKTSPYDIHLFKIPFSAIKTISIGARANDKTVKLITEKLINNSNLMHVELNQFNIHNSEYKLVKAPCHFNNEITTNAKNI